MSVNTYFPELELAASLWSEKRDLHRRMCEILSASGAHCAAVRQMLPCADTLRPVWSAETQQYRLYPKWGCGFTLCPACNGRKYRAKRPKLRLLPGLLKSGAYEPLLLTGTMQNCPVIETKAGINNLRSQFNRMMRCQPWKQAVGSLYSFEVTRSASGQAHPHYHALILMPAGILNRHQAADFSSMKLVRPSSEFGAIKWAHYLGKPSVKVDEAMLDDPPFLLGLLEQLYGVRMFTACGKIWDEHIPSWTAQCAPETARQAVSIVPDIFLRWNSSANRYTPTLN